MIVEIFSHLFLFSECKVNDTIYQDGDTLANADCTEKCKCSSGMLIECSPIDLPACPAQGCFPEEEFQPYKELPGCPPPCPSCPPGR